MITFATVTSINDDEFDDLFAASLPSLNAGSYPWHLYGDVTTDAEKKAHIRSGFDRMLTEGFLWRVSDDDGVLLLNAGVKTGTTAKWVLGLVKPDANNSKAYLYGEDYRNARDAYWTEIGITSWTLELAGANTPVHTHALNRQQADAIGKTLTESTEEVAPVLTLMNLTVGT